MRNLHRPGRVRNGLRPRDEGEASIAPVRISIFRLLIVLLGVRQPELGVLCHHFGEVDIPVQVGAEARVPLRGVEVHFIVAVPEVAFLIDLIPVRADDAAHEEVVIINQLVVVEGVALDVVALVFGSRRVALERVVVLLLLALLHALRLDGRNARFEPRRRVAGAVFDGRNVLVHDVVAGFPELVAVVLDEVVDVDGLYVLLGGVRALGQLPAEHLQHLHGGVLLRRAAHRKNLVLLQVRGVPDVLAGGDFVLIFLLYLRVAFYGVRLVHDVLRFAHQVVQGHHAVYFILVLELFREGTYRSLRRLFGSCRFHN